MNKIQLCANSYCPIADSYDGSTQFNCQYNTFTLATLLWAQKVTHTPSMCC